MIDRKINLKVQVNRSESALEDESTLSQFSPDSSPLLKATFQPSEVLLFKGIPGDLREVEVMPLFHSYGLIKDILIAHHKRYLFVQFEDEDFAVKCYQDCTEHIPNIRNHDLYVCYTGKNKISKPKALLNPTSRFLQLKFNPNYFEITSNQVLQMLPPYGACERILVKRAKTWEAYLEMEDVFKAIVTKDFLQSQNLAHQFTVSFASERDFGKEDKDLRKEDKGLDDPEESKDLASEDFSLPSPMGNGGSFYDFEQNFSMTAFPCFPDPYGGSNSPVLSPYRNASPVLGPVSTMQSPASPLLAGRPRGISYPNMTPHAHAHAHTHSPQMMGNISPQHGSPLLVPMSAGPITTLNNVLLVKNLPENITPLMLFKLFGMYGNVMKIKILFNNPEKAFIEFQSPLQAELARAYLSNSTIMGKSLKIDFAKKGTVVDISLLKKEPDNQYLGDYSGSADHRYKYVGSKNHANISPPSKVLHLSNMHPDKTEKFYKELFKDHGRIKKFIFMKCEEKMALVQMESVEDALAILMNFHNFDIDGKFLKVSFSKYKKVKS